MMLFPALFLDRDGVINVDHGYVHRIEQIEFIDGIFDLVRQARSKYYKVVVVTNQAGIGRGYYTEEDFNQLTEWMLCQFVDVGASIGKVYFSPYHPIHAKGKYLKDDFSRKPKPGMLLRARDELQIDLSTSVLIGDKESDIQAGIAAGVGTNLLLSPHAARSADGPSFPSITSLQEAFPYLRDFSRAK